MSLGYPWQILAWRKVGLVAAQAKDEALATSRAACVAGFVVPAPDANPGLVRDCEALLAVRATLFGELLVNWGSGTPLARWEGVTVTGAPPRVTGLALRGRHLGYTLIPTTGGFNANHPNSIPQRDRRFSGAIPAALGALDHLQRLDLASNALAGPIPPELGNLTHLSELDLAGNNLDGPIPVELGQLTSLTMLDLRQNRLTGQIPQALGRLGKLKQLYVANNRLTGCIPVGLKHLRDNDPPGLDWRVCEGGA